MKNLNRCLFLDSGIFTILLYVVIIYSVDTLMTPWGQISWYDVTINLFNMLGALAASYFILGVCAISIKRNTIGSHLIYASLGLFILSLIISFITYGDIWLSIMNFYELGPALIFVLHFVYGMVILLMFRYRKNSAEQVAPRNR
jgi:hypothetical protein